MRIPFISCIMGLAVLIFSAAVAPTLAQPLPPKKDQTLSTIEDQVKEQKEAQKNLEKEAAELQKDMKSLKSKLVDVASKVQDQETAMTDLETKLAELRANKQSITASLTSDKKNLAELVMALERIKRLPPQALVARPDAPLQTAQAATVLSSVLPELDRRAAKLKLDLDTLQGIEADLTSKQDELKSTSEKLKSDRLQLDTLVKTRVKALKENRKDFESKEQSIAQLSKSAKDLKDLIAQVDRRNREIEQEYARQQEKAAERAKARQAAQNNDDDRTSPNVKTASIPPPPSASLPALGTLRMPVSGSIRTRFGELDDIGAKSQGVTIESRPGAVVVAPLGGIVRYAGPFKKYGSIILLEHKNKFHSLVAGLGKIDTFVGQSIDAGEPLGRLPDYSGRLYYELRLRGDPVNPSQKFSALD